MAGLILELQGFQSPLGSASCSLVPGDALDSFEPTAFSSVLTPVSLCSFQLKSLDQHRVSQKRDEDR